MADRRQQEDSPQRAESTDESRAHPSGASQHTGAAARAATDDDTITAEVNDPVALAKQIDAAARALPVDDGSASAAHSDRGASASNFRNFIELDDGAIAAEAMISGSEPDAALAAPPPLEPPPQHDDDPTGHESQEPTARLDMIAAGLVEQTESRGEADAGTPAAGLQQPGSNVPGADGRGSALGHAMTQAEERLPSRLLSLLNDEIAQEPSRKRRAVLQHERGHLLERYLNDESGAARAYAEALSLDPGLRPNLWAIRRTLVGHGRWEKLLKLFDAELRVEKQDDRRRAELLLEKGWLLEDRFGRREEAIDCLWQAHALTRAGWLVPLLALERIAAASRDTGLQARVYQAIATTVEEPERRAAALRELARLQESTDGAEVALETLDQAASLSLDRTHVLVQMEAVTARGGLPQRRVAVLRALGHEVAEGEHADRFHAAALLLEAAWLARSALQDLPGAQALLQEASALCPRERLLQLELRLLAETQHDSSLLVNLLTQRLSACADSAEQASICFQLALAHLSRQDPTEAAQALGRCLDLLPGYLPALVELERAALAASDPQKLVDIWLAELGTDQTTGAQDASYRAHLLWRAALVNLVALDQHDEAALLCERALELDPDYISAQDLQLELLRRVGDFETLAEILLQTAQNCSAPQRAEYLLEQVVSLALGPLGDPTRAEQALALLAERPDASRQQLYRLAEVLERQRRFVDLDALLQRIERLESRPEARSALRLRRAAAALSNGNEDSALAIYREELGEDPTSAYALSAILGLLRRKGDYEQLARELAGATGHGAGSARHRGYQLELLSIYLGPLDAPQRALELASRLAAQDPTDLHLQRRLELAARRAGRPEVIVEALRAQAAVVARGPSRTRLELHIAEQLEDTAADVAEVLQAYDAVIESSDQGSPTHRLALWGAARQHVRKSNWTAAGDCYARLRAVTDGPAAAWLREEQAWIESLAAANGSHEAPLEAQSSTHGESAVAPAAAPESAPAREAARLRSLLVQLAAGSRGENASREAEARRLLAESLGDTPLTTALHLQRASLLASGAGLTPGADQAASEALQRAPDSIEAMLTRLQGTQVAPVERAELLVALSKHMSGKLDDQVPLLIAHAEQAAGRPANAARALKPLLAADPDNLPALLVLQRTAAGAGCSALEGNTWLRIAGLLREPEARGMAYGRAGALFETLGQPASAACAYRRAVAAKPNDRDLMDRLEDAYRDACDDAGLEDLLGMRLRQLDEPAPRTALLFQRAELRAERLDNPRGAARDLVKILLIAPNNPLALMRLAQLCDTHGDLERAEYYYRRLQETSDTEQGQRDAVLHVAQVLVRRGELEQAAGVCRQFLESYPQQAEVWERLAELYLAADEKQQARGALARLSELPAEPAQRAARLRRLAQFLWRELGDPRQARDALLSALEADATDLDVLGDLRQVCRDLDLPGDFSQPVERAKAELRQAIGRSPLDVARYERLLRLAEWSEDQHTLLGALGALCCLNAADPAELDLYRRRVHVSNFDPRQQIPPHAWRDSLVAAQARGALSEIWRVVVEALPKLYRGRVPSDVSSLGVGRDDRVSPDTGGTIARVARTLGVGEFELYVSRESPRLVDAVLADPPALVIGHELLEPMSASDRFRLGRTLYLLRDKSLALELLSSAELQQTLASAVFAIEPGALQGSAGPQVEEHSRVLQRNLSRRARRALPLAVNRLLQEGSGFDVAGWARGVLVSANRAAYLVCADIIVAMQQLVEPFGEPGQQTSEEIVELLQAHPLAAELLPFSVSTQYLELRRLL